MKTQHTPTPWEIVNYTGHEGRNKEAAALAIHAKNGQKIFAGPFSFWALRGKTEKQAIANAAFIVRACNAHDLLVHELMQNRQCLIELRDNHLGHTAAVVRAIVQKRIEAADEALAKAKGE